MNKEQVRAYSWDKYMEFLEGVHDLAALRRYALQDARLEHASFLRVAKADKEREFWQGKFNTVKHENNRLRANNRALARQVNAGYRLDGRGRDSEGETLDLRSRPQGPGKLAEGSVPFFHFVPEDAVELHPNE